MHNFFSKNAIIFSVKTCIAAFLSFYIALLLNFEKPAWSLTTVYVVSQYYSASTISKSVYRLLGTVLGGLFVFFIYPLTVQSPLLFSFSVSLWVAFCLYFSLKERKPSNYIFMLGGYSAAIIGFPDVATPEMITWSVISRIEEISLAIICSSLIHSLILPVSMRKVLDVSIDNWLSNARKLCGNVLSKSDDRLITQERKKIYQMLSGFPANIENTIAHCEFDGSATKDRIRTAYAQMKNLSYCLPVITALETRLKQLNEKGVLLPDYIDKTLSALRSWLYDDNVDRDDVGKGIKYSKSKVKDDFSTGNINSESSLLLYGVLERADKFLSISRLNSKMAMSRVIFKKNRYGEHRKNIWHIDMGMLLLSCFTAFLATFSACLFWAGSGWKDGSSAPMIAAIICSFYATLDKPTILMQTFLKGTLISAFISILYIAMLIPLAITIESLIICLAPALFLLGLIIARPTTNIIGIVITAQIPAFISMGHHFKPDLLLIVNGVISMVVGVIFAVVITAIIRNRNPEWTAKRAFRKGIYDLIRFNEGIRLHTVTKLKLEHFWLSSLDKSYVIIARKNGDQARAVFTSDSLIYEAWLAENMYGLCIKNAYHLHKHNIEISEIIIMLNGYLKSIIKRTKVDAKEELLQCLDRSIFLLECETLKDKNLFDALFHLHSIRLTIFPLQQWPKLL